MTEGRAAPGATLTPAQALALAALPLDLLPERVGPKRIVILGGGFAGVYTAKRLTELLGDRRDVEVELLGQENYFVFQPLLPEVAAGGIAATHVVNPIREMVPGARFRVCKVLNVDTTHKRVLVSQGDGLELHPVPYDHLVFCLGKVTNFSVMPGAAEHAFAMKDLSDAFTLRNHVIRCLEHADIEHDPARKAALLTFVVAGGGFSGVETVGELHELVSRSLKYFTHVAEHEVKFKLIHSQEVILPEMPKKLGLAARAILEKRGIEMILGARVKAASPSRVYLQDGRCLRTRTFVCTVGNAPNPVAAHLLATGGFEEAKQGERKIGVFLVDRTLRCVGKDGYWAVGDCAAIPSPSGEGFCPPTAQFAIREARACAENVVAAIDGKPGKPFSFKVLGMLASLGQRNAVAQVLGIPISGFLAWFIWRTIYLSKLPGVIRRLRVMLDWTLDLFFPRDITQLQVFRSDRLRIHHYEPGELILEEGQIGRELYMITAGEVEVIKRAEDGGTERVLDTLGPKEVFGERALLEDIKRTASVRSVGQVDVLVMSRGDFRSMVAQFPVLEAHFAALMRSRYPDLLAGRALMDCVFDPEQTVQELPEDLVDWLESVASSRAAPSSRAS